MTHAKDVTLFDRHVLEPRMLETAQRTLNAYPDHFPSRWEARRYMSQIIVPASKRWAFLSMSKNASTSTLAFLFAAEFGTRLTAQVSPPADFNPDGTAHWLEQYHVFARALRQGIAMPDIAQDGVYPLRTLVVRDPLTRATSGFRYLCKSHREASQFFARERVQMNAVVGFHWDTDCDTVLGFEKFLDFLAWQIDLAGMEALDRHFRGQTGLANLPVFQPTLTGRMEDTQAYFAALTAALDLTDPPDMAWANRQPPAPDALTEQKSVVRRVEAIFAEDYETFGY